MIDLRELEEGIEASVAPIIGRYKLLDEEIVQREAELSELKAVRTRLRGAVKLLDPSLFPADAAKKNGKPKKGGGHKMVGEATVATVHEWLVENARERFSGAQLLRRDDLPDMSQTTLNAALRILHERGALALRGTGRGGARVYEVVR